MRKFIGFEGVIENFKYRCNSESLSHAHLISGEDGIGKSILAQILAKLILKGETNREYVDIINYKLNKASFGVEDVRNLINEVNKKPFESSKKVIIIHKGNKLTIQAQNALLKTIEEPPIGVYIIILCENLELILDTIKSRCEIYKLTPLSKIQLNEYIELNKYVCTDEEKSSAIAFSEGIPGRIDRYFNDETLSELRVRILELLNVLKENDPEIILEREELLSTYKDNKEEVLNIFFSFIRDILIHKEVENEKLIINGDKLNNINELAKDMSFRKLNNMIKQIEDARRNIKSNVSWPMILRVMLMGFMEV